MCTSNMCFQNNTEISNIETNTVHLPNNIYGRWLIEEYVSCSEVGRDSNDDYINDTLEIQKDYIIYNGIKMKIENIEVIYESLNYSKWLENHYLAYNFMNKNDVASYYNIELRNVTNNEIMHKGIIFTDKGKVYITTSYACLLGKAVRTDFVK